MEETSLVEEALPLLVSHGVYFAQRSFHLTHFATRLIFGIFFGSMGYASLLAPKVAMYTALACRVHRPEYVMNNHSALLFALPSTHNLVSINAADTPIQYVSDGSETAVDAVSTLPLPPITVSSDYTQNEPGSEQKCASDPVVQEAVARLNAGLH
jgi:hypothetical protein